MSKLSSYSRIKKFQYHKVSVLPAPQVSAYTRNQCGMMWKHPSVSEQGAAEALRGADCDPHSEKVLGRDKTECGSGSVREMPFNTPGRQENSQESG